MLKISRAGRLLAPALTCLCLGAHAADEPKPRKDAAEAVQEGNVQNWVEYYRRTRPVPDARPPEPAPDPAAAKTGETAAPPRR
jgi:hypothetical protein